MTAIEFLRSRTADLRAAGRWVKVGAHDGLGQMIRCDFDGAGMACPISALSPGGPFPAYDKQGQNWTALGLDRDEAGRVMNVADGWHAIGWGDIREAMLDAVGLPADGDGAD